VRVAAVDCGTNSVRLLVADVDQPAGAAPTKVDLHREMRVVRLGQGVDRTGELAPEAVERTRLALVDYAATCRELGVERLRMVATSATRDARNRDAFASMVLGTLGVPPEVVSGDEEAALSFDGATRGLDPAGGPYLVVDIGGGSTELVLGTGAVEAALSVDVGCVRLTERHLAGDPPDAAQIAAATADVDAALERVRAVVPVERTRTCVGLAGSVTTVAAVALDLPAYDADRIHLSRLSAADVARVTSRLLAMTRAERAALPVMHPGRVDVIGAGALVLATVVERFGLDEVLVSESDILDGIAWSVPARPAA
jgi:exopolyphosphatase/guanosine-5'-triphosphate,3'-diphosphate pyrophosphatase